MGKRYLLDTNIVIYYLGGALPDQAQHFLREIFILPFSISIITRIELFSWNSSDQVYIEKLNQLVSASNVIPLDDDVIEQTVAVRKRYKKVKLPDAIIAATCLARHFTLITRNTSDFRNIADLDFINPFDL